MLDSKWHDGMPLQDLISRISQFVQKYTVPPPSLVYRFSRLTGWKTPCKFLALIFFVKLVFVGLIQREYTDGMAFNYGQDHQFHRRWQEMTSAMPYEQWYAYSCINPQFYFPLDYPPLPAYLHMLLDIFVTKKIVPESVLFSTLHFQTATPCEDLPGIRIDHSATEEYFDEDGTAVFPIQASNYFKSHKYFVVLRISLVLSDVLSVGLASLFLVQYYWRRINPRLRSVAFLTLNFLPILIFFDHSNTQINYLSVSTFLISFRFALSQNFILSAFAAIVTFLLKQNSLPIFVPFGVLVLAKFYRRLLDGQARSVLLELGGILLAVSVTPILVLWPFLDPQSFQLMYRSIFPFFRGVFSTDLPTLWPFVHKIVWVRNLDSGFLLPLCAFLVLLASSKGLIKLAATPSNSNFALALQQSCLCFFAFGYEIHEKNIMWYLLTLNFSLFQFPVHPHSFMSLFSILLLTPNFLEFGKDTVVAILFIISLLQHRLLSSLPHPPTVSSKQIWLHQRLAQLPKFLGKLLPYFQVYVGVQTVIYFIAPGQVNDVLQLASYYFIFVTELALIAYHNSTMDQLTQDQPRPFLPLHPLKTQV